MNAIEAQMGDALNAVRCVIISTSSAFTCRHVTVGIGAVVLSKNGAPYRPNGGLYYRYTDGGGVLREDAEQNFSISARTNTGLDGVNVTPYRLFPTAAIEPLASAPNGSTVQIFSRSKRLTFNSRVTRGTPNSELTIECDFVPTSGDSGSLVTLNGVFVGFVSAISPTGFCLVSVPSLVPITPPQYVPPAPITPPVNPASVYAVPDGSSYDFRAGVVWERQRQVSVANAALAALA